VRLKAAKEGREAGRRRARAVGLAIAFAVGAAAPALVRRGATRLLAAAPAGAAGRDGAAESPLQISGRGWTTIIGHTIREFAKDRILAVAAGATFYALLALFPALAAFVSLYGLVADVGEARAQILSLAGVLPGGAISVLGDQLTRLGATDHGSLGFAFATGLGASLLSANAGVKALIAGLNVAYEEQEKRNFLKLNALSLGFTLAAVVFSAVAIAAVIAAPGLMRSLGFGAAAGLGIVRWPVLLVVVTAAFSCLYRYGPSRQHARWRWVTPGAAVAAVGWMGMSLLFSWYVANFGHYNQTYGSLGAAIGFMTWIWLSLIVVLFGAELNSELEMQTMADTTTGPPQPAGSRGAYVADHKTHGEVAPRRSGAPAIH
jgi:membrane protein